MKATILSVLFFDILVYVSYCSAVPTCSPTEPPPVDYFKLRVWNHWRSNPYYNGFIELNFGAAVYNFTSDYPGFDVVV